MKGKPECIVGLQKMSIFQPAPAGQGYKQGLSGLYPNRLMLIAAPGKIGAVNKKLLICIRSFLFNGFYANPKYFRRFNYRSFSISALAGFLLLAG